MADKQDKKSFFEALKQSLLPKDRRRRRRVGFVGSKGKLRKDFVDRGPMERRIGFNKDDD